MDLRNAGVFVVLTLLVTLRTSSGIPLKLQVTSPGAFVGEGINALAVALLQDSQQSPAANVAFSPLGHAAVLAALAEGAAGATQGELLAALRLPRDAPLGRAAYRAVLSRLQEKKKLNQPEFRNWFYVYKTAVQVEKNYAELLRDNYLMEVHDIEAPETELPSELADKRKPGVQQGSSDDEELPEIPFEKPAPTAEPAPPEQPAEEASAEPSVAKPEQTEETKAQAPVEQEGSSGAVNAMPSVDDVVAQEANQTVPSVEEQTNDTQTVSPMDLLVPATELLPPLEDPLPLAVQPDKQAHLDQQIEQNNQVSGQQDTVKSEVSFVEERPQVEDKIQQENVKSEVDKPVEDPKNEQVAIVEEVSGQETEESQKEIGAPGETLSDASEQQTSTEASLENQTTTLGMETTNAIPSQHSSPEKPEEMKQDSLNSSKEEIEKPVEHDLERNGSSEENTTNLGESSVPFDTNLTESTMHVESREGISFRAPASPITAFNALYFRGAWATPFDSHQSAPFNLSPNTSVSVNMLGTIGLFRVGDIPELSATAVELPYNGSPNRYSLLLLLPQDTEGALNKLTSTLSTRTLRSLGRYMTERLVHVQVPEFEIGYVSYPQAAYKKLGIKAALDANSAEFPGISRSQRLFLQPDALAQLVRFRVDATSSSTNFLSTSSLSSNSGSSLESSAAALPSEALEHGAATRSGALQFRADRPFIFVLRDNVDKLTLVAGRISDPSSRPTPPLLP